MKNYLATAAVACVVLYALLSFAFDAIQTSSKEAVRAIEAEVEAVSNF